MKRPLETARRWLIEAQHNVGVARVVLENGLWSKVCFESEQSAQLALKAFLYSVGRRSVYIHSVRELALECAGEDAEFEEFMPHGMTLDKYYLSTRYPDTLPEPAIPFESFSEQEAIEALGLAAEIVEAVSAKVSIVPPA